MNRIIGMSIERPSNPNMPAKANPFYLEDEDQAALFVKLAEYVKQNEGTTITEVIVDTEEEEAE